MRETAQQIRKLWLEKIALSAKRKDEDFGKYARECWQYYSGPNHNFLFGGMDGIALDGFALPSDSPRVTVNKCFEMVDVFLPYMHHRNPTRTMTDRRPKVPPELKLALVPPEIVQQAAQMMMQQQAQQMMMQGVQVMPGMLPPPDPAAIANFLFPPNQDDQIREIRKLLMEPVLNYTPHEFDLKTESRLALTEGLVTGRAVWWTEMVKGAYGELPGSSHVPVEYFFCDPDFNRSKDWTWVARERYSPRHKFAERFGIAPEQLRSPGGRESNNQQAVIKIQGREKERHDSEGTTHDLIRYWEIYSRCGMGHHLSGADDELKDQLESLGPNVYLVITDAYDEPLNFRSDQLEVPDAGRKEEAYGNVAAGLQWPVPFHLDSTHPWPFTLCDFHHQNNSPWPVSHMRPALGCQKVIDWIWSHVAAKIRKSGGTKFLYEESLDPETRDKISSLTDHEWIGVRPRAGQRLTDMVYQMEIQPMNRDLFEVAQYFSHLFEITTGVSALLATGESGRQMRSSYEAQLKEKIIQSRPEAMADTYEDAQSRLARNEAVMLRRMNAGEIAPFFQEAYDPMAEMPQIGENTRLWMQSVYSPDDAQIMAETDFRIESGSMRKPNIGEALTGLTEFTQVMMQPLMQSYQMTGDPTNMNILLAQLCQKTQMPIMQLPPIQPPTMQQPPPDQKGAA